MTPPASRPRAARPHRRAWAAVVAVALALGCSTTAPERDPSGVRSPPTAASEHAAAPSCPTDPLARTVAPDVTAAHRDVATWLDKLPASAADAVLIDPSQVPELNARFSTIKGAYRDPLSDEVGDPAQVAESIEERIAWMRARVDEGGYVEQRAGAMAGAERIVAAAAAVDEVRLVIEEAPLWCVPLTTGLFKEPVDPAFDRNRCASLHPGELIRVLRRATADDGPWLYVDSGHTTGWLQAPVVTAALPAEHVRPLWSGPQLLPLTDAVSTDTGHPLRLGTRTPLAGEDAQGYRVLVPAADGPTTAHVPKSADVSVGARPLTRRGLWSMALAELDKPYGWGGTGGSRDCSRFLRDLLVTFGVELARHSGVQAKLGTERVDVAGMSDGAKRQALAAAAKRGVVLLYMPGHIMLYLGRDSGRDYAVSAISEWLEPCPGGKDTVYRLDRVAVTTLELGRDTERTAYIERITTLVVFGPTPAGQSDDTVPPPTP